MLELEHRRKGNDYEFVLFSGVRSVWQNRVEKSIYIDVKGSGLKVLGERIDIGVVSSFEVKGGFVVIRLLRPLRYETRLEGGKFVLTLKDITYLSSIGALSSVVEGVHDKSFVVDLHNDLAFHLFMRGLSLLSGGGGTESDLIKLRKGGIKALFFAIWVPSFYLGGVSGGGFSRYKLYGKDEYVGRSFELALSMIRRLKEEISVSDEIRLVGSVDGIMEANSDGKIAALIGLEGLHSLGSRVDRLDILYDEGVRYIGLTWSNSNEFADSSTDRARHGGLSGIGKELIRRCMDMGFLIDISHSSDSTVRDTVEVSGGNYPLIASHSGAKAITVHKRNLSDDMIKVLARGKGIIGLVFHSAFLRSSVSRKGAGGDRELSKATGKVTGRATTGRATIEDLFDHIDYIAELASVDNVALGSDFDGFINPPLGLEDMSKFSNISLGLYNRGYSLEEIRKILGGNFIRVFRSVEERVRSGG